MICSSAGAGNAPTLPNSCAYSCSPSSSLGLRLKLEGPNVFLTPEAAQHIGLALHELATNAAKYGAWSVPTGHVTVTWETFKNGGEGGLRLSWRESNGPRVAPRSHLGFGSTVTEKVIANALDAKVAADFAPDGFCWTIEIASHCLASGS